MPASSKKHSYDAIESIDPHDAMPMIRQLEKKMKLASPKLVPMYRRKIELLWEKVWEV